MSGSSSRAPARARCRSSPTPRRSGRLRNASMSKFCLTSVTSLSGFIPFFDSAARCSNSLPKIQTPNFLPAHLLERVDAADLNVTSVVPLRAIDLADVDEVVPGVALRERARHPVDAELGLLPEHDLLRDDVRPAGLDVHVEARLLVVALAPSRRSSRRTAPATTHLSWSVTFVSPWPEARSPGQARAPDRDRSDHEQRRARDVPPSSPHAAPPLASTRLQSSIDGCQLSA